MKKVVLTLAALSALAVTAAAQDVDDLEQFKAAREREMSDYQSRLRL